MSSLPQLYKISAPNRTETGVKVVGAREASRVRSEFYIRYGKRIFDIIGAAVALVMVGPFLFLCAVAVRLESRGPVFFRQWRVGQNGMPFQVIKLRSMVHGADKQGPKITASGDPRITRVGRF